MYLIIDFVAASLISALFRFCYRPVAGTAYICQFLCNDITNIWRRNGNFLLVEPVFALRIIKRHCTRMGTMALFSEDSGYG
ncbi:hypothetical protein [Snodgrassella sp. M0351]|uniref:hypothetical protein n=1 Tax=Snodgrassella sp. M0351 TaxID=2751012 RepID=UPI0018DE33CC|nr:hypothetical protein [Snodgrassella sp. M0351]MBI0164297.1 hypothetical protein [Snodgrassella sp. M0351]